MNQLCLLLFLVLLFLISIILMVWVAPRYIGESEIIDDSDRIGEEFRQLIMNNYRVEDQGSSGCGSLLDDFSQSYPVNVYPEEITLVSGCIDPHKSRVWSSISKQRFDEYASYHGYQTYYFDKTIHPKAPLSWQKIYAVRDALRQEDCQVVVWFDDDVIITTPQRSIQDILAMTNKPIIFSMNNNPQPDEELIQPANYYWNVINNGVFIIRKTPETLAFLDDVIAGRTTLYDGYFNKKGEYGQGVMIYYLYSKYHDNFALMPDGYLQTFHTSGNWRPECFSLHLTGESTLTRYHVMKRILDNTKIHD